MESFYLWLKEHEGKDFDFETWSKMLKAHDEYPLFITYMAGLKHGLEQKSLEGK